MDMKALLLKLNQISENTDTSDDQGQNTVRAGDFSSELVDRIAELQQAGEVDISAPDAAEQIDAMMFFDSQDKDQEPASIPEIQAAIKQILQGNNQPGDVPESASTDITENAMTPEHKELAKKVHKALLSDEPAGAGFGAKLKAAHTMLRQQYGSDWRKKAGVDESMAESMAYGQTPAQSDTSVSYSETKRDGDASVTISANANSMADLHRVLKLAGIDPDVADKHTVVDPAASVSSCGCDEPSDTMAPTPVSAEPIKQAIIDRLRDTLKAKMAL